MDCTYTTIRQCLSRFNFERVHAMMTATDWKWSIHGGEDGFRVPTIQELEDQAERLLFSAVSKKTAISTGGFRARCYEKYEKLAVSLEFVAAETHQDFC
jgi:hypothetical protein